MLKNLNKKQKQKLLSLTLVGIAALLLLFMVIPPVRQGLVGIFGWAVISYILILFAAGFMIFKNKKPNISAKKIILLSGLFLSLICTLHVLFAKDMIQNPDLHYIGAPAQGYETAGGALISIITAPFYYVITNYAGLLATFFVITAAVALFALYPLILRIPDKPKKPKAIVGNSAEIYKERLNVLNIDDDYTPNAYSNYDSRINETAFLPKEPYEKPKTLTFNEQPASQKRMDEVFYPKTEIDENVGNKYGSYNRVYQENEQEYKFYTDQGRKQLCNQSIAKTFGETNPEKDFRERFGSYMDAEYPIHNSQFTIHNDGINSNDTDTIHDTNNTNTIHDSRFTIHDAPAAQAQNNYDAHIMRGSYVPVREDAPEIVVEEPKVLIREPIIKKPVEAPKPALKKSKPYTPPPIELLPNFTSEEGDFPADFGQRKREIEQEFTRAGIPAEVAGAKRGPTFTRYEVKLDDRQQIAKVPALKRPLTMALGIEERELVLHAPLSGKDAAGIDLPNKNRDKVSLRSMLSSMEFLTHKGAIPIAIGKDLYGFPLIGDLTEFPHLLVAGSSGTGKSVFLNCLILSILYKTTPEDVRMLLIDPKMVEFSPYQNLPNLLIGETVKEIGQAITALRWAAKEIDKRNAFFSERNCRNIKHYNDLVRDKATEPKMPRIVIIIDEVGDLISTGKKEVEGQIIRIARLGRSCGIHLVVATQRPTTDVISNEIKQNMLCRIAFTVTSQVGSRVILDEMGAENLIGKGDMIMSFNATFKRLQGAFTDDDEIFKVCDFLRKNNHCEYNEELAEKIQNAPSLEELDGGNGGGEGGKGVDEVTLKRVLKAFIREGKASISNAQARHNIGYLKAKKVVEELQRRGYVSTEQSGNRACEVLIGIDKYIEEFGDDE
jgi:DNA segregation ATPase FtsK/SpoIIIE-like protein